MGICSLVLEQQFQRVVLAAVVDVDDLSRLATGLQFGADAGVERVDDGFLVVDRHDQRDHGRSPTPSRQIKCRERSNTHFAGQGYSPSLSRQTSTVNPRAA